MAVNASTRQGFLEKAARLQLEGATCIGCGLKKALEVLNTGSEMPEGAIIVVLTDGLENRHPNISSVMPQLKKAKVTVNSVGVGVLADPKLEQLAMATKGTAHAFQDLRGNLALQLTATFVESTTTQLDDTLRTLTLVDAVVTFKNKFEKAFPIDGGVGNKTVVVIQPNSRKSLRLKARLVDPSGNECKECKETPDGPGIVIAIPSPAKVGTWKLKLETESRDEMDVTIQVKTRSRGGEPIRVTSKIGSIIVDKPYKAIVYAKVTKGKQAVLDAVVRAEVTGPKVQGKPDKWTIQLHDDGRDPDNHADDGTYSAYFTKFIGKGRYGVTSHVSNQDGTRLADDVGGSESFFSKPNITVVVGVAPEAEEGKDEYSVDDFDMEDTPNDEENPTTPEVSKPMDDFVRVGSKGTFEVTENITEEDVPPGRIRDLTVAGSEPGGNGTLLVDLTWTWPGAHMTEGKASSVTIRASEDYASVKSSFDDQTEITKDDVVAGNLDPLPSGAKHAVTVALPATFATPKSEDKSGWSAYIAARITNSYGGISNTSNIVEASYTPPPVTTTRAAVTNETSYTPPAVTTSRAAFTNKRPSPGGIFVGTTTTEDPNAEGDSDSSKGFLSIWSWILIFIVVAAVVAIIAIAIMRRAGKERPSGTDYTKFGSTMTSTMDSTTG
ncbi:calcium-activated chloride channel regulator 1-like [Haemaphysalis longicornis]